MKITIPTSDIESNHGQIKGVPGNPRRLSVKGLTSMCDSIREAPDFLDIRPLAVVMHKGKYVCLGGNTRLKAARRLGLPELPCVVIPEDTDAEKLRRFVIKDNGHYGEWDADILMSDWGTDPLEDWGAVFDAAKEKKAHAPGWKSNRGKNSEHRTTLTLKPSLHHNGNHWYLALYRLSLSGYTLDEAKQAVHVDKYADDALTVIEGIFKLAPKEMRVMTTPRRRHKDFHFATEVCRKIAQRGGWNFIEDAFTAKDKCRLNPVFEYAAGDGNGLILLFDDIVTTGSTLKECHKHFPKDSQVITVVGVFNREEIKEETDNGA